MPRLNQNLEDVDENAAGGWRALPEGSYTCKIIETDYKQTRAGNGMVLSLKFDVLDAQFSGRSFFDNLTLEHPNADTVAIARAKLKQLAIAVNHPNPDFVDASEDLEEIPLVVRLAREKASKPVYGDADGYQNRVLAYETSGAAPTQNNGPPSNEAPPPSDSDIPF